MPARPGKASRFFALPHDEEDYPPLLIDPLRRRALKALHRFVRVTNPENGH